MRLPLIAAVFLTAAAPCAAQRIIASGGTTSVLPGGGTLSWTVGESFSATNTGTGGILTPGFQQGTFVRVNVNIKAFLQGPWTTNTPAMTDGLRTGGHLPLVEPYSALGYPMVAGGGFETIAPSVLQVSGANAIVDWIYLQLRDAGNNTSVQAARCALVQRDGDIVDVDGVSPVTFTRPAASYFISVQHRNHLGILSQSAIALAENPVTVNFTNGTTATFGTNAQRISGSSRMLWAGDATGNGVVKYTGSANDRDPILTAIGGSVPTATITGYRREDITMDGTVKYAGGSNDRDVILQVIGGTVPTATHAAQLP